MSKIGIEMPLVDYSMLMHHLMRDVQNFDRYSHEWYTPNTYDPNFKVPPESPGVYLLYAFRTCQDIGHIGEIVYIGSSKNLAQRKCRHEVLRMIHRHYHYIQFYFREIATDYKDIERTLIQVVKPKYNTQHING